MEEEEKTRNPLVYLLIGFVILVIIFSLVSRAQSDSLKGTWSLMGAAQETVYLLTESGRFFERVTIRVHMTIP